jgi:hypothetical protein
MLDLFGSLHLPISVRHFVGLLKKTTAVKIASPERPHADFGEIAPFFIGTNNQADSRLNASARHQFGEDLRIVAGDGFALGRVWPNRIQHRVWPISRNVG